MNKIYLFRTLIVTGAYLLLSQLGMAQISGTKSDGTFQLRKVDANDAPVTPAVYNLVVDKTGKVGIGTGLSLTGQAAMLQVKGIVNATGFTINDEILSGYGPFNVVRRTVGTKTYATYTLEDSDPFTFQLLNHDSAVNSFIVDYNGNVGIGTLTDDNLTHKLSVKGRVRIVGAENEDDLTLEADADGNATLHASKNVQMLLGSYATTGETPVTDYYTKLILDQSGHIGIGKTPAIADGAAALQVKGAIEATKLTLSESLDGTDKYLSMYSAETGVWLTAKGNFRIDNSIHRLSMVDGYFQIGSGMSRVAGAASFETILKLDTTGHIGIGKTPSSTTGAAALQVKGTVDATNFTVNGQALSTDGPFAKSDETIGEITSSVYSLGGSAAPASLTLKSNTAPSTAAVDNFIVDYQGHVGIGTPHGATFVNALTIAGSVAAGSLVTEAINTTKVTGSALTMKGAVAIIASNADPAAFEIAEEHADVKYSLFVDNGVVAEDFIVATVDKWADFVFEKDYRLLPLNEVENFITENKHLPGVPSAEELKDGYAMHQMNTVLMKKIEELTLYIIEQEKRIKELEYAMKKSR